MNILWTKWLSDYETKKAHEAKRKKELNEAKVLIFELDRAFNQWKAAERNFHEITGKDQVDYAIFAVEAAEKRYEFLLKEAKRLKIRVKIFS